MILSARWWLSWQTKAVTKFSYGIGISINSNRPHGARLDNIIRATVCNFKAPIKYCSKKNPITGTMEAAESLKAHQSGIQYFAGSLSAKIANNMGINETKLIFSDRAIQHGRRWVKIRYNPKQVLPLNEVKNLLEMMSDPDEIHFDMRDRTYLLSEIL